MKHRAMSFITVLALCLSLCPTQALAAGWAPDALDAAGTPVVMADDRPSLKYKVAKDTTIKGPYDVTQPMVFETGGYSYTATDASALRVLGTGSAYLTTGTIESKIAAGVEVLTGGFLCVDNADMEVIGKTYALDISAGATAQLSGGTFTGEQAAIRTGDGDYSALLKPGCAYFDASGNPIPLADMAAAMTGDPGVTTVMVKECTVHSYSYEPNADSPTHDEICDYCGTKAGAVPCRFEFDENGHGECAVNCGHTLDITIDIDEDALVYDGTPRPGSVSVTVKLDGNTTADYEVDHTTCIDAGETVTVTVSGETYKFTKSFHVVKDTPKITWKDTDQLVFDYRADKAGLLSEIKAALLSNLKIEIKAAGEDLSGDIQFSYKDKEDGDAGFTDGLPTNAGAYEVKASFPGAQNYHAASSEPIGLTINKVDPDIVAPVAIKPVYNGTPQKLVTSGAAPDDAEIQFALSENGPWSRDIPTGINAGDYVVWYRVVDEANNYNVIEATSIDSVKIKRKEITPTVELEYYTCVYDGGDKEPKVTVRDEDDYWTVLPSTEYEVTYAGNQNVGTAAVTVTDKDKGNYKIKEASVYFNITPMDQDVLTITGRPNTVIYGDVFTLGTSGGSGSGAVTWKITDGDGIAEIGEQSGQVTVKGVGTVTVLATKSEGDSANHKDATAQWTFTAGKRSVTAAVTAENKTYDGKVTATVTAVVEQGVVSGDTITITVTGTFSDADAGTGKTVTVDTENAVIKVNGAVISGAANEKYTVTIPGTATADIAKVVSKIVTPPTPAACTYSGKPQELLLDGAVPNNKKNIQVEYALSNDGPWSTALPSGTDAGRYEVWYRAQESTNYTAIPPAMIEVTIAPKRVTVSNSNVTLTPAAYVYDGTEKKPAVTVKDGDDVIPASEYTVTYSNNVNVGTNATVTITDKAGGNYEVSGSATFSITVGKAELTGTPRANDLTYNGNPQDLVSVGSASGGSLAYALAEGGAAPAKDDYKPQIPQGKDAGQYTVYYMVKGDGNHTDTEPSYLFVTIQPKTVSSPVITLEPLSAADAVYNGQEKKPKVTSVKDGNDIIMGPDDEGEFSEYTVTYSNNVNAGTATVHIIDNNGGNYIVTGSKTFEITKATAKFTTSPQAKTLTYNTKAQPLITAGVAEGGTAVYSLGDENGPYSAAIPTGTDRDTYKVWAKVLGDGNHEDSDPIEIQGVEIGVNNVASPTVTLSSTSFRYDGSEQKPTVTVKDDKGNVIPANEYTVTYGGSNESTVNVGTYTITITCKTGGNYSFSDQTETVRIYAADQTPLTITGKPGTVYYGDTIQLSAAGGTGSGTVVWSVEEGTLEGSGGEYIAEIDRTTGLLTINGVGRIVIKAARTSDTGNYAPAEDTWVFYAKPKPVAAVVTAASKPYDGNKNAALSVAVPVAGITITVKANVTGTFDSANVGTNRTVIFTITEEQVTVSGNGDEYYEIIYPGSGTTTASITPAPVDLTGITAPQKAAPTYNGSAQDLLVAGGSVDGGKWAYSEDGVNFSLIIPKGTDAGGYTVWYKVIADSNHTDTEPVPVEGVTIAPAVRTASGLEVLCTPSSFPYDGTEKTPGVTVWDKTLNREIPAGEYTVEFPEPRTAVGTYTVTVKDKAGIGNYEFNTTADAPIEGTFTIVEAGQDPFCIVTDKAPTVRYGDTFRLSAAGGSGTGTVTWTSVNEAVATVDRITGVVEVIGTGSFTITATRSGDGNYSESSDSVSFLAEQKPVTPVITAASRDYNGGTGAVLTIGWKAGDLVGRDSISISNVTGTFDSADVGTNKTVTINSANAQATGINSENYLITYPDTTTSSITPASTTVPENAVQKKTTLKYTGSPQELVERIAATAVEGGSLAYSLNGIDYTLVIPTGKDAGDYTVWYKVFADSNHTDSEAKSVVVTIGKEKPTIESDPTASSITAGQMLKESQLTGGKAIFDGVEVPGTFTWTEDGDTQLNDIGTSQHAVTFTPADRVNFEPVTTIEATVEVKEPDPDVEPEPEPEPTPEPEPEPAPEPEPNPDTGAATPPPTVPDTESASVQISVQNGTASAVLNTAAGNQLVDEAIANRSGNVVIKPEFTGDVTKTEVSIPASAVNRIGKETDAVLTVSTPVADVSIPNGALDTLSSAGGTVSVITERAENRVVLTLTANGEEVEDIPGGLTLTVPVEDAGPGTVAVLVYEDGTRETVRKSVMADDVLRIPLDGPATVEIVDNSKEFEDVPAESWAADAVAFASAREMFNGTSKTTFSPELIMSRATLATVLYNLEGCPDQGLTNHFSDISSDTWYTAGVSWAAANGITGGYGNGQFGPNDSITREQLAVMLWRYAGSPSAGEQSLDFTDADQASGYAMEALYWATENGILNGYGNGHLDPCGLATRAQAAQMLKNFIENT